MWQKRAREAKLAANFLLDPFPFATHGGVILVLNLEHSKEKSNVRKRRPPRGLENGKAMIVEAVEGKFLLCKLIARQHAGRRSRVAATIARQSDRDSPRRFRSPTVSQELKTTG